jgi:uncharacterized protein (TIGR02266 family)
MGNEPASEQLDQIRGHLDELKRLAVGLTGMKSHISKLKDASERVRIQEESVRSELSKYGLVAELEKLVSVAATPLKAPEELDDELAAGIVKLATDLDTNVAHFQRLKEEVAAALDAEKTRLLDKQTTLTAYLSEMREKNDPGGHVQHQGLPSEETMAFEVDPLSDTVLPDDEATGRERRKFHRESVMLQVKVEEPNRLLSGRASDVSVGGIFVVSPHDFELGQILHVTCVLPSGRQAHADGVVAWLRDGAGDVDPGVGIEFLALDEQDREQLERLMKPGG